MSLSAPFLVASVSIVQNVFCSVILICAAQKKMLKKKMLKKKDTMCCRLILVSMVILTTITFLNASYIYTFAGNRGAHSLGDGGPATSAQLRNPADVTLSSTGEVYIADTWSDRIRMVFTNGTITTFTGNGVLAYSGDGGPATSASIAHPCYIQ
jgi:hypothetical protein